MNDTPQTPGPARVVDMTPSWESMVSALALLLSAGTEEGKATARAELIRMARLADMAAAGIKAARAAVDAGDSARSEGPRAYAKAAGHFDRAAVIYAALDVAADAADLALRADLARGQAPAAPALVIARAALAVYPLAEIMADTRPGNLRATARDLRDALADLVAEVSAQTPAKAPAARQTLADLFAEEEEARAAKARAEDGESGQ